MIETGIGLKWEGICKYGRDSCKKSDGLLLKGSLVFTAVVILLVGMWLSTGEIKTAVAGTQIKIAGSYWANYAVELSDVNDISYLENFEAGMRTNGFGGFKLLEGHFKNNAFGNYILYAYAKCNHAIVINTAGGNVVVNAETQEETQRLYQTLQEAFSRLYSQEYIAGQGNIKGDVDTERYSAMSADFAIGANDAGYAVFKDPKKAFSVLSEQYAEGVALIQKEYELPPLTDNNYGGYKTYGWQVTTGTATEQEQRGLFQVFLIFMKIALKAGKTAAR